MIPPSESNQNCMIIQPSVAYRISGKPQHFARSFPWISRLRWISMLTSFRHYWKLEKQCPPNRPFLAENWVWSGHYLPNML